jgi:hypothetical protein
VYTNVNIRQFSTFLFAHTPAFNEPDIFTHREVEQRKILALLTDGSKGATFAVSAPLGAGKTFLLKMIIEHLKAKNLIRESEVKDAIISIRRLTAEAVTALRGNKILILDELDRKEGRDAMLNRLADAGEAITASIPYVVLSGDQSLSDIGTWSQALGIQHEVPVLNLEPLTPAFLLDALEKRAQFYTPAQSDGIRELIDREVLGYLVPPTDPPLATFRDVFALLMDIAQDKVYGIPMNDDPCRISPAVCKEWAEGLVPVTDDDRQIRFLSWLRDHVRELHRREETFTALSTEQCMAECRISGVRSAADYEATILAPLAEADVLRSCGVPYVGGTGGPRREPPPYLPSVRTWLRATFDKDWP